MWRPRKRGSKPVTPSASRSFNSRRLGLAFSKVLQADVVKLFDFLHDQLLFVDFDNDRSAALVPSSEAELSQ
jgi:hypothetical protein